MNAFGDVEALEQRLIVILECHRRVNMGGYLLDRFLSLLRVKRVNVAGALADHEHVDAGRFAKRVPQQIGHHETDGLKDEYKRHPLIVGKHFGSIYRMIRLVARYRISTMGPAIFFVVVVVEYRIEESILKKKQQYKFYQIVFAYEL